MFSQSIVQIRTGAPSATGRLSRKIFDIETAKPDSRLPDGFAEFNGGIHMTSTFENSFAESPYRLLICRAER